MRCFVVLIFIAITFSAATGRCQDTQFPPAGRIAPELQGEPDNLPPLMIANEHSSASMIGVNVSPPKPRPGEGITVSMFNETSTLKLSGSFSILGIAATERTFVPWNPLFVLPPSYFGNNTNTFELHSRQSSVQAVFSGPEMGGFKPGAFALIYLMNGSLTSDTYGLLPILAFADLQNEHWRFSAGLQNDLFAPRDPTVIPIARLGASGNPGSFRGQVRLERSDQITDEVKSKLQIAFSDPITTILIDSNRRSTEGNGLPNLEGRGLLSLGAITELAGGRREAPAELAIAGLIGELRNSQIVTSLDDLISASPFRRTVTSWGVSVDGKWNVTRQFGVSGEGYLGQAIGNYAANIFQTFNSVTFAPVRGAGGWGEVFYYFSDQVHLHAGYGIESVNRSDLAAEGIARNSTYYSSVFWDITKTIQVSCQVDYRQTDYVTLHDNHALVFYSQMLWRF